MSIPDINDIIDDLHKNPRMQNLYGLINFFSIPDGAETGYIWHDAKGKSTNDPKRVKERIPITVPRDRRADKDADFELIYQRELSKAGIPDGDVFNRNLTDKAKELLNFENNLPENQRLAEYQYLMDRFLKWLDLYQASKSQILRPEFEDRLLRIESKIQGHVDNWRSGKSKIECAAFTEILYQKNYLVHNSNRNRQICAQFARKRYNGIDISIQMGSGPKESSRIIHQSRLKRYFD